MNKERHQRLRSEKFHIFVKKKKKKDLKSQNQNMKMGFHCGHGNQYFTKVLNKIPAKIIRWSEESKLKAQKELLF